jgi:lipoate-protein ligase A
MSQSIRLLPFAGADGATNMAADEAMLESAVRGVASLRFYTWTEPTLSLGYFQPAEDRAADPNLSRLAWVRRSTGGAAIVHDRELTYALALPPGKEWYSPAGPRNGTNGSGRAGTGQSHWICRFHHILQRVLKARGVESHAVVCGEEQKLGPVVCFLHQTPGDLLIGGSKVAGSAQRKMRGALLQHGSILLHRSEFVPHLAGINDRPGTPQFAPKELAGQLALAFAEDTGWAVVPGEWTAEERERTAAIRAEKYANRDWNEKR